MYNKREENECDEDYVMSNFDLAVQLLNEYGLEILGPEEMEYKKPDFSGEDREYLNKYGPSLSEIEGDKK